MITYNWRDPVTDPPPMHTTIIVAREKEKGKPLFVEQGTLTLGGWYKVYGTNVKRIVAWTPMPDPPENKPF